MGANNHPTVDVSNEPETIYKVVNRRDSYNPVTVGIFNNEQAAEKLKDRTNEEMYEKYGKEPVIVRERDLYESVEQYNEH